MCLLRTHRTPAFIVCYFYGSTFPVHSQELLQILSTDLSVSPPPPCEPQLPPDPPDTVSVRSSEVQTVGENVRPVVSAQFRVYRAMEVDHPRVLTLESNSGSFSFPTPYAASTLHIHILAPAFTISHCSSSLFAGAHCPLPPLTRL